MEKNYKLSPQLSGKSLFIQSGSKIFRSSSNLSQSRSTCGSQKKTVFDPNFAMIKEKVKDNKNIKISSALPKRPNTVSYSFRKEIEYLGRQKACPSIMTNFSKQSKSSSFVRESVRSTESTAPSTCKKNSKPFLDKIKAKNVYQTCYKIDYPENLQSASLLTLAIYELGQLMQALRAMRKDLRKKMFEKILSKSNKEGVVGDHKRESSSTPLNENSKCVEPLSPPKFRDSYANTLEEIFQAWLHLFYFIMNLRINLIRVFNLAGTEPFKPNTECEKKIITQAIECVKFYSRLKLNSLIDLFEELCFPDNSSSTETQIINYEEGISSPFFFEMSYIEKKAKELIQQIKREK